MELYLFSECFNYPIAAVTDTESDNNNWHYFYNLQMWVSDIITIVTKVNDMIMIYQWEGLVIIMIY